VKKALLHLLEKVSAKLTDEDYDAARPLIRRPSDATFSRKGRRG
jgi:hypothetical protein